MPPSSSQSVGEQAATYALGQAVSFPLNLLFDLLVARALGPAMRGQWFLVIAAVTLVAHVLSLGIPAYAVYRLGKAPEDAGRLNVAVLKYACIVGAVAVGAALLLGVATPQLYAVGGLLAATELYMLCSAGHLTGLGRIHTLSRLNVAAAAITVVVGAVPILAFGLSALGALTSYLLARVMAAILMARAIGASGDGRQGSAAFVRDMVRFGVAGHLGNLAVLTYQRVNLFLVGALAGASAVGQYSVAESLSTRLAVLVGPLQAAYAHRISGASQPEAVRWTAQLVRIAGLMLLAVGIPLVALADPLLRALYGTAFAPGAGAFRLLLPASALTTVASLVAVFFSGHAGRPMVNSVVSLATMAMSIPLSYALVRNFGMAGGAWAALASGVVIFALVYGVFAARTRLPLRAGLLPQRADWEVFREMGREILRSGRRREIREG